MVGGGQLQLQSFPQPQTVCIEFAADAPIASIADWVHIFETNIDRPQETVGSDEENISFGLSFSHEIIIAHNGTIGFSQRNGQTVCRIELPTSTPDLTIESDDQLASVLD